MSIDHRRLVALLSHPSPALRYLVLSRLAGAQADVEEIRELQKSRFSDPYVSDLATLQQPDGAFHELPQTSTLGPIFTTAFALAAYGFLGFDTSYDPVARGAEFLLSRRRKDGTWSAPVKAPTRRGRGDRSDGGYDSVPLQTAIPLRGLCAVGLAGEPAVEAAFGQLLEQRLPDGAWPTGRAQGSLGYVAGYRRLPHSRWGCRSNTTGAVSALSANPALRHSEEARKGVDHLLSRETNDRATLGFEAARLSGYAEVRGFMTHFAAFDSLFILGLAARCGVSREDARVAALVAGVTSCDTPLIETAVPAASAWATYDAEMSLRTLSGDWIGMDFHTPYRSYPREPKRF